MPKSAREIMDAAEFEVELPNSGFSIRCRKIGNLELVLGGAENLLGMFEDVDANGDSGKPIEERFEEMTKEEKRQFAKDEYVVSKMIVMAAAIEPRVVDREWTEIDRDEEIHVSLIDKDINFCANRIIDESGLSKRTTELPFRPEPGRSPASFDGGERVREADGIVEVAASGIVPEHEDIRGGDEGKGETDKTRGS